MRPRTRVFCEFLAPEILGEPATIALLERHGLEPIIALPPEAETELLGQAVRQLHGAGIPVGAWPLFSDGDGYWLSTENAGRFPARAQAALAFLEAYGVRPRSLTFDLEPPLEHARRLFGAGRSEGLRYLASDALSAKGQRYARAAVLEIGALSATLRGQGIEVFATILPLLLFDLGAAEPFTQALFHTPVARSSVDVICPMAYSSMIGPTLGLGRAGEARLVYLLAQRLVAEIGGARASLALGLVGPGKLGNEAQYQDPSALREDVAAARAAGISDLAIFSLEGILSQPHPERWLDALKAEAKRPAPHWVDAGLWGARTLSGTLSRMYAALRTSS